MSRKRFRPGRGNLYLCSCFVPPPPPPTYPRILRWGAKLCNNFAYFINSFEYIFIGQESQGTKKFANIFSFGYGVLGGCYGRYVFN